MCEISVKPRDASVDNEILHTYRTPVRVFKNKHFAEEVFQEAAEPELPVSSILIFKCRFKFSILFT